MREKQRWPELVKLVNSIKLYCEQNQSSWDNKNVKFIRAKAKELSKFYKKEESAELEYRIGLLIDTLNSFEDFELFPETRMPAVTENSNSIIELVNFELSFIS